MVFLLKVSGCLNSGPKHLQVRVLHIEHRDIAHVFFKYSTDSLEVSFVRRGQQSQRITRLANSSSATTSVNVDFSVEWTLIVNNILHVGDVKTASSHVCADENGTISVAVNNTRGLCLA